MHIVKSNRKIFDHFYKVCFTNSIEIQLKFIFIIVVSPNVIIKIS